MGISISERDFKRSLQSKVGGTTGVSTLVPGGGIMLHGTSVFIYFVARPASDQPSAWPQPEKEARTFPHRPNPKEELHG
jgi:hypothetical protein